MPIQLQEIKALADKQKAFFYTHKTKDVTFRINALKKLQTYIRNNEDKIAKAIYADLKKAHFEVFATEIGMLLDDLSLHIKKVKKWSKPRTVLPALNNFPSGGFIKADPYGTVLIIAPWNYPFLLTIQPLIGAISAGNTALVKPSELAENTAQLIEDMIKELFPPEYIAVIQGDAETAKMLLQQKVDLIFYTGNETVAKYIMKSAAEHLTPVILELGGKTPTIIDKNANLKLAARRVAWGKFINAGQTCVAPDYILVHESVKEDFVSLMKEELKIFYEGNSKSSEHYARIINKRHFKRLTAYLKDGDIVSGGETDENDLYISPTILDNVNQDAPLMKEEIFGPLIPVIPFKTLDEVIFFINERPKPLALYYFSTSRKSQKKVLRETSSGGVCINDTVMHLGNHRLPFGGVGSSGMGAYHGKFSFETFSHLKSVLTKSNLIDIPIRYAPYNGLKLKLMKLFFG